MFILAAQPSSWVSCAHSGPTLRRSACSHTLPHCCAQTLTLARDQSGFLSVPFTPLTPLHPSMTDSNLAALAESVAMEDSDGTLDVDSLSGNGGSPFGRPGTAEQGSPRRGEGFPEAGPPRRILRSISSANSNFSRTGGLGPHCMALGSRC